MLGLLTKCSFFPEEATALASFLSVRLPPGKTASGLEVAPAYCSPDLGGGCSVWLCLFLLCHLRDNKDKSEVRFCLAAWRGLGRGRPRLPGRAEPTRHNGSSLRPSSLAQTSGHRSTTLMCKSDPQVFMGIAFPFLQLLFQKKKTPERQYGKH